MFMSLRFTVSGCRSFSSAFSSDYNRIFENTIVTGDAVFPRALSEGERMCIQIAVSDYNEVYGNNLRDSVYGINIGDISFGESQYNNIYGNYITNVDSGVDCSYSSDSTIHANNITDCGTGICLTYSDHNRIFQNNIENCGMGISIYVSNTNRFYSNNFIDNGQQVFEGHTHFLYPGSYLQSVNNMWYNGTLETTGAHIMAQTITATE
jgi:parallel beta-helix repeat protein